ncbi:MAG: uroporphyrinogen decarboxylase [Proteobacteria bacterium]|nr:uroporphyrinogen decarboxylase [Pseudomonadota bacterium]
MNIRFQNAIQGKEQKVPPIWFMRQAGRYHKHYQALRQKHSFMELCKNPDLAAEVTMGPIMDFDFDVAIIFSDLLFPLEALGMGLDYAPGPKLGFHLNEKSIDNLKDPLAVVSELDFQRQALIAARSRLPSHKSLIGFVGGPWTLFSYAVQGTHDGHLLEAKKNFSIFPKFSEILLPLLKENIKLQLAGGAEVVMVFDTAAGALAPQQYTQWVVPVLEDLAHSFPGKLGYYARDTHPAHYQAELFQKNIFAGMGYDHRWKIPELLGKQKGFVQGNFDQSLLFLSPSEFQHSLLDYLKEIKKLDVAQRRGWVCGLGHGVLPNTPEENVRFFVRFVREFLG